MFFPGKPFLLSLRFASKTRILPKIKAIERCFTWLGSRLTRKYETRTERLVRDKHSCLLLKILELQKKSFITLGPGSTVVEHSTHDYKIDGSNLASGPGRHKMVVPGISSLVLCLRVRPEPTYVKHLTGAIR